jgi:multimeric flavodoxin WrbA
METIKTNSNDHQSGSNATLNILFICGSPRRRASFHLVELLEQGAQKAGADTQHFLLSEKHIDPCIGCGSCNRTGICALASRSRDAKPLDDYQELKALIDQADAVGIVAPLYFAGPTSQFKALMDRFQPYYAMRYVLGQLPRPKRPAQLFIVGAGGDPHGYDPMVGIVRSAFQVAGFTIDKVHDFVGFLSQTDTDRLKSGVQMNVPETMQGVRLRRAVAHQEDFAERAVSAGGAFARYIVKQQEANQLTAQLEELKAEMEELKSVGDRPQKDGSSVDDTQVTTRQNLTRRPSDGLDFLELEYSNLLRQRRAIDDDISAEGITFLEASELPEFDDQSDDS